MFCSSDYHRYLPNLHPDQVATRQSSILQPRNQQQPSKITMAVQPITGVCLIPANGPALSSSGSYGQSGKLFKVFADDKVVDAPANSRPGPRNCSGYVFRILNLIEDPYGSNWFPVLLSAWSTNQVMLTFVLGSGFAMANLFW
jgi:hypothetical protein